MSLMQTQQSRSEIPFVFRHWRGAPEDGDGINGCSDNGIEACIDDRSPARRHYIDQYRAEYTYAQVIRDFEPEALQSSYVAALTAESDASVAKSTVDSRGANSRRRQCGGGGSNDINATAQVTASPRSVSSWEVAASVVASGDEAGVGGVNSPAIRPIHHQPLTASKLSASDPALSRQPVPQQLQPDAADRGNAISDDRTTHRSAPPAVITQVHFARRKINVPTASNIDDSSCADGTDADGIDELATSDPRQRHQRKLRCGRSGGAAPVMRTSVSCGSLPTKVNLEPPMASSSTSSSPSPSASVTSAPANFLPRVAGGSCCSNGGGNMPAAGGQLQSAIGSGTAAAADATDAGSSNNNSASAPGHQLLVAFTGKTIKPIPSNGFSIDRSTS